MHGGERFPPTGRQNENTTTAGVVSRGVPVPQLGQSGILVGCGITPSVIFAEYPEIVVREVLASVCDFR